MKIKPQSTKMTIIILGIALLLALYAHFNGFASTRTATRIGYVGNEGSKSWSATYTLLDGTMQRTLNTDSSNILHIEAKTENGKISFKIKDKDGKLIFSKDDVGSDSYDVTTNGKTTVIITADNHKGSFNISCE